MWLLRSWLKTMLQFLISSDHFLCSFVLSSSLLPKPLVKVLQTSNSPRTIVFCVQSCLYLPTPEFWMLFFLSLVHTYYCLNSFLGSSDTQQTAKRGLQCLWRGKWPIVCLNSATLCNCAANCMMHNTPRMVRLCPENYSINNSCPVPFFKITEIQNATWKPN